jgi:hypothetical protein
MSRAYYTVHLSLIQYTDRDDDVTKESNGGCTTISRSLSEKKDCTTPITKNDYDLSLEFDVNVNRAIRSVRLFVSQTTLQYYLNTFSHLFF